MNKNALYKSIRSSQYLMAEMLYFHLLCAPTSIIDKVKQKVTTNGQLVFEKLRAYSSKVYSTLCF